MNCYEVKFLFTRIRHDEDERRSVCTEEEEIGVVAPTISEAIIKFRESYPTQEITSVARIIELLREGKG